MQLAPGQTLLHFRLVDKIGEGGMGEVWKAIDTRLEREVAIKFIPGAAARDSERIGRFEREAKVLASLSHPNIAGIYEFPEADLPPPSGEKVRFLSMELVRGEDLYQILSRGPLPIPDAIDAARQIATALEVAHASGIIHRDLKPANIKRTPECQIKVLDFGLAKAFEAVGARAGTDATVTSAGSTPGLIVGSASYMSPEQARGQAVDRRTDIWAFGCVLYEMLTGKRAFDGATVTDVLAAVVTGEPQWDKLPAATPIAVRRLLRRCLEKDPRRRLRDAGDVGLLLDETAEDVDRGTSSAPGAGSKWRIAALLGLVTVIALAAGWWIVRRQAASQSTSEVTFHRVSFNRGLIRSARFAPDGHTIVYGAAWGGPPIKLYMSRTESPEAAPLALPPGELLAVSKRGEMAMALGSAYYGWMAEGTLARTSLLGGAPREILQNVRAADWSPDESQFAVVRRIGENDQLEYPVGKILDKTSGYFADVRVSPDGEHVAYVDHPTWGDNLGGISMVDLSGKKTALVRDLTAVQGLVWGPGGNEIWYTDLSDRCGRICAVDLTGKIRVVYSSIASIELFDIASDGRLLLGRQQEQRETLALLAGFTEPRVILVPGEASWGGSITSDGRVMLVVDNTTDGYDTFLLRSDQPSAVHVASGGGTAISPDRSWVMTATPDIRQLFVTPTSMGAARPIPNPDGIEYRSLATWLPDSRRYVITGQKGSDPPRGFVCDLETGAGKPFGAPGLNWRWFLSPPVSPDGKRVVLQDADGAFKLWPLDGGDGEPVPGARAEDQPLTFTEDGAALFVAGRSLPVAIERLDLATGNRTAWLTLAPSDPAGLRYALASITPNGKYWSLSTAKLLTDLYVVEGLR